MSKRGANYIPFEQIALDESDKEGQLERIATKLTGNNGFHPILRATLEAAYIKGMPHAELGTLEAVNEMAGALAAVDEHLKNSDTPQPIVAVTHRTQIGEGYILHNELQFDYGFSVPEQGLQIQKDPEGYPNIKFPTHQDPAPVGIATPSWNSHYAKSTPKTRAVILGSHGNKTRSRELPKPEPGDFSMPVPAGSLSLRNKRPWPQLAWPNHAGSVQTAEVPKDFIGRADVAVFVGRPAVKAGLSAVLEHMVALQSGEKEYNNHYQPKYSPRVVKEMVRVTLSDIGQLQPEA